MITLSEDFLYSIINENLETIVGLNINSTYNNIKYATIISTIYFQEQYDIINELVPISESSFFELITTYFTDQVASQLGRLFQALFVGADLVAGSVMSGVGGVSSFSVSMLTPLIGTTAASMVTGLAPLLILAIGFAIYKYIKTSDVKNVNVMIKTINKLSDVLKFKIDDRVNTEFKVLLKNKCITITDKKLRVQCAINGYIKYLNSYVLIKLINHIF